MIGAILFTIRRHTVIRHASVARERGLLAATKPSSENAYTVISLPEAEMSANLLGDSASPSEITVKNRKRG